MTGRKRGSEGSRNRIVSHIIEQVIHGSRPPMQPLQLRRAAITLRSRLSIPAAGHGHAFMKVVIDASANIRPANALPRQFNNTPCCGSDLEYLQFQCSGHDEIPSCHNPRHATGLRRYEYRAPREALQAPFFQKPATVHALECNRRHPHIQWIDPAAIDRPTRVMIARLGGRIILVMAQI